MRNPAYERRVLAEVTERAERQYSIEAPGFADQVLARLALGARSYGDQDFMSKDVMRELREEAWDAAAYSLLEAQKLIELDDDELDARMFHLAEIIKLSVLLDWHSRMAGAR